LLAHDLFRKPVPIPDQVEDKLFGIMRGPFASPGIPGTLYLIRFPSQIMGVSAVRLPIIAGAATFLLMPLAAPANACGAKHSAQVASSEYSAATTKKKVVKKKKEKVEYMRSAAPPEPKK
jgi:hypothetical protein